MPTYDYKCDDCGYDFEYFQAMSDATLTTCPECRGSVRRLIGGGLGVIFKGSGFYVTDSRKSSPSDSSSDKSGTTVKSKESSTGANGNGKKSDSPAATGGDNKGADSKQPAGSANKG